jgi:signal transduction histidine kinase
MLVSDLLTWITQGVLLLIASLTVVDFLRRRGQARLDIALMFGALASIVLFQGIARTMAVRAGLVDIGSLLLIAQPYLLLRLVQHFRTVPQVVRWLGLGGLAVGWAIVIALPSPLPVPLTLLIVAYFTYVECYAAVAFVTGALRTSGVTQRRLLFAASGSGLLALLILIAGANTVLRIGTVIAGSVGQVLGMLAMLSYYVGFTPPRWLRQTWQLAELQNFLRDITGRPTSARASATLDHLCLAGLRAVGGLKAVVGLWDDSQQQLVVQAASDHAMSLHALSIDDGAIGRAWRERQPIIADTPASFGAHDLRLTAAVGAGALLAVPIATHERAWGMLVVFLRRAPLFAADDLRLLELFTEQSAIALDFSGLLNEQHALVGQLRERTAQLEVANKELEAFSYSASHDLRAPLRAIDGFSRILLEDYAPQLPAEAQSYLQLVRDNTRQMGQLIDALLAFARLSHQPMQKQLVVPTDMVQRLLDDLQAERAGRCIQISIGALPPCAADPSLLRQVWINLLSNALKYTRQREQARIEIGAQNDGGAPVYYIRDNGVGFDMQYAGKLFGVFQRLHRAEQYEGTGVGLAIAQRIIQRHGGLIWSTAEVEKGATFYFTLPQVGSQQQ